MKSRAEKNKKKAIDKLAPIGQTHLLQFYETLPPANQENLLKQIEELDLDLFRSQKSALQEKKKNLYPNNLKNWNFGCAKTPGLIDRKRPNISNIGSLTIDQSREFSRQPKSNSSGCLGISPLEPFEAYLVSGNNEDKEIGKQLVAQGKAACLVLAGGQGSRLRFEGPKGCYPISKVKKKSLYQLIAERVKSASELVGQDLLISFMTSPINHSETELFFMQNNFFGLKPTQVNFFNQKMWPLLDFKENLFLEGPDKIAVGPNGNGEVFSRFSETGIFKKWKEKGIEAVNIIPVDNPLALPFDFELFGFQQRRSLDVAMKTAWRKDPKEKVGILVRKEGIPMVVEYTEIDEHAFQQKAIANLGLYAVSMSFIEKARSFDMPLHVAKKAVKKITKEGKGAFSKEPNAWKFEKFIFDAFAVAEKCEALLYPREECFAPLKNLEGEDSIMSVQAALLALERNLYTRLTGVSVHPSSMFELSSEFYYPSRDLQSKWSGKSLPDQQYIEA